jgi:hypothetical protein
MNNILDQHIFTDIVHIYILSKINCEPAIKTIIEVWHIPILF